MFKKLSFVNLFSFSQYLNTLYQTSVRNQTPFFTVARSSRFLSAPQRSLFVNKNSIALSSQRIGISSLYLGTGTLQRHLLAKIKERHQTCPDLKTAMVFDYNRSHREQDGESPYELLTRFVEEVGNGSASVSFMKASNRKGVLGQISGVHHQKIYLFDNKVIMGGANLSKNYFLNRRDRYVCIHSAELSDYLFEYLMILAQQPQKPDVERLKTHYKLWKYAYMPAKYHPSFNEQLQYLNSIEQGRQKERSRSVGWQKKEKGIVLTRNKAIADQIGTSITHVEQISPSLFAERREQVRSRLFSVSGQDYVGNELQELGDPFASLPDVTGQSVHLFPFIQWPMLNQNYEYELFKQVLQLAAEQGHLIRLSSGYFNLDQQLLNRIASSSKLDYPFEFLCSAPEANSFFKAGKVKGIIPAMYRCYEYELLKMLGAKAVIKQFSNGRWSFHAKGLWLQQSEDSYLTVVGSSNFNARSRTRDTELQLYIYSSCKLLNNSLNKEWEHIQEECKQVHSPDLLQDGQTRVSWPYRTLSRLLSSFL